MIRHHRKIMGDQHHRQAALLLDVREDIAKHLLPRGVHAGGRLVEQEDLRIPFQGHGQEDPLHFSAGQFPQETIFQPSGAHPVQALPDTLAERLIFSQPEAAAG